jgi:hypothetical protein
LDIELKDLAEKIRQYLSGIKYAFETNFSPEEYIEIDRTEWNYIPKPIEPEQETAIYINARNIAREIKQKYPGLTELPPLCESNPKIGLQALSEWCIDNIGSNTAKNAKTQPASEKSLEASGGSERDNIQETLETIKLNTGVIRDQVFICYSHKDERWLIDLQKHLKPYVRDGSITAWSDKQITPGSKWFSEINAALDSTKVAVLLVTPDFLASDFIHKHELGPLLKEAEKGGVRILWILVRACSYKKTLLKDYQAVIDPDKPLVNFRLNRDKVWVRICEEIEKAVKS